jgi:RHS repeat-associated protein
MRGTATESGNRIKKTTHRYFHGERSTRLTTYRWDRTFALPMLVSQQGQAQGPNQMLYGHRLLSSDGTNANEGRRYYLTDHLGSVTERTDENGEVTDSFRYEPFGAIRGEVSTGQIGNGFAFAGEYADAETGFYNLRARTYDPGTGRFLQPDPLGVDLRRFRGHR